jgi:hypothetical protein
MKRIGLTLGCLLSTVGALAADPVATATPVALAAPAPSVATAKPETSRQPLNLAIGDIREYMSAEEFRALSADREPERNTVIVEARAPLLPMKHENVVPGGILAPFWALANPTQAWRIFMPDINRQHSEPLESKIPPPVFRWGP